MGSIVVPELPSPLIKLHSKDHEEILNVIDELRSEGISRFVGLPQLIVCGDQSSGKSSVLEAISGLNFPRKDNLCTRFATELILRRAATTGVSVSILPDPNRSPFEKEKLANFKAPDLGLENFADIIHSAGDFIGVGKNGQVFSKDVLRVEFQSPTQLPLTLVDLPGLYHAPDESQDQKGVAFVESLVLTYMKNPRSVILAVVSAKNDLPLQKVTALTRKIDPRGRRTMGIITKPDTLPKGSDMEHSFYQLAMNNRKQLKLGLGWHVLRNRDYEERDTSFDQRCLRENEFFSEGIWASLPPNQAGIDNLRPRLSSVLRDHILSSLPGLISDAQGTLNDTRESLLRLEEARQTLADQRRYLFLSSERFSSLLKGALDGVYSDRYFGDAMTEEGYAKRARAVVQNRLIDFSENMRCHGEARKIVDDNHTNEDTEQEIRRSSYIREVQQRIRRSRGCELPGTFNPLIIGELFYIQSKPWEQITASCIELLISDLRKAATLILKETVDPKTFDGILHHIINPKFYEMEQSLKSKTDELLRPQQKGHPITYNSYFTDSVQTARERHHRKRLERKLGEFFSWSPTSSGQVTKTFEISKLASALTFQTEIDLELFACSEATDCMLAYYKIARKKFVDDFCTLAVEKCLVEPGLAIFNSRVVDMLQGSIVEDIAAEDESSRRERRRLDEKVAGLEAALLKLHRLDRYHLAEKSNLDEKKSLIVFNDEDLHDVPKDSEDDDVAPAEANGQPDVTEATVTFEPETVDESYADAFGWGASAASSKVGKKSKKHSKSSLFMFESGNGNDANH